MNVGAVGGTIVHDGSVGTVCAVGVASERGNGKDERVDVQRGMTMRPSASVLPMRTRAPARERMSSSET